MYAHILGRLNSNSDLISFYAEHHDCHFVTNLYGLLRLASHYQHLMLLLRYLVHFEILGLSPQWEQA